MADPLLPGLYFLWRKPATLVYIGMSENVTERLKAHESNGRQYDYATIMAVPVQFMRDVERELIELIGPVENRGLRPRPLKPGPTVTVEEISRIVRQEIQAALAALPPAAAAAPERVDPLISKAAAIRLAGDYDLASRLRADWDTLPFVRATGTKLRRTHWALESDIVRWCEERHREKLRFLGLDHA